MPKLSERTILILAVIFSICFITLLWFLNPACTTEAKLCPEISISPTSSSNPTANWKTYTDTKNQYTFRYPANWTVSDGVFDDQNQEWIFGVAINNSSLTPKDWVELKRCPPDIVGELCHISVGQIPDSVKYISNAHYTSIGTVIQHNNSIFEIIIDARNPDQPVDDISTTYDQILSTFKFIENKAESNTEKQIGYIKKVYEKNGQNYLSIDYIQMLSCNNCPDGYKIVNDNPLLRDFIINPNVEISLIENNDLSMHKKSSLNDLINFDKNYIIFNIEINNLNKITKISQVFTP